MQNPEIEQLEIQKAHALKAIALGKCAERLSRNKDFKKLILEEFFEQEPQRLVLLMSDPNFQTADAQQSLIQEMKAIGSLRQFLSSRVQFGLQMQDALDEYDATLEELHQED